MKRSAIWALTLAAAFFGQNAVGETIEDVLKEKGVITEAEYQKVTSTSSPSVTFKPGEGFTFTSADKKHQGSVGGFLQLRYTYTDLDEANNTTAKSVKDSSQFSMARAKIFFNGYSLTPDLTYKFQLNITQGNVLSTGKEIEEAYVNYRLFDELQFRFGQDKVPFARQFIVSSASQQFMELSHVATAFAPGYDAGTILHGKVADGLLTYAGGVFGGAGQGTAAPTTDNAFVGRIAVNPLGDFKYVEGDLENTERPKVSFGANYYADTIQNGSANNVNILSNSGWIGLGTKLMPTAFATDNLDIDTVGYDAAFKWRGVYAQAEYFSGRASGSNSHRTLRANGFYGQAGYFVIPGKVELAARYAWLDPNRDVPDDHWVETTGGMNWYFDRHNLKLQADYTNIHKQRALALNSGPYATDDRRFRVQMQLFF